MEQFKNTVVSKHFKDGLQYHSSMNFNTKWAEYERFLSGDQWPAVTENSKTKTLPRPVFNIINFILSHKKSSVQSETLKIIYTPEEVDNIQGVDEEELQALLLAKEGAELFTKYSTTCWEKIQLDKLNDELLISASTLGSGFLHFYWDNSVRGGVVNKYIGEIAGEFIDPSNIFFGNPNIANIQKQPYITIVSREMAKNVQSMAKENGVPDMLVALIKGDKDLTSQIYDGSKQELNDSEMVNVLTEYYYKNGEVHFVKVCNDIIIKPETNTSLRLYPIALMNWRPKKGCIYGTGDCEGIIANQKAINFLLALQILSVQSTAWPKILVKPGALKQKITNTPGEIITDYSMNGDGIKPMQTVSYNPQTSMLTDTIVNLTKEFSNATESALGIAPGADTSAQAIMLLQKSAGISLEDVRARFHRMIEDVARIWLEFFCTKYNMPRPVLIKDNETSYTTTMLGIKYREFPYSVKIDIGNSSQYSEISQQATLDKLFEMGAIDVVMYVKYSSDNNVPHKESLLKELETNKQNALAQMQGMGMPPQGDIQSNSPPSNAPPIGAEPPIEPTSLGQEVGMNPVYPPSMNYIKEAQDIGEYLPGLR